MEALLNVLWLVIAVLAFAGWKHQLVPSSGKTRRRHQVLGPFLALTCALAILFPAISVTDDLHPALFVVDDAAASRRGVTAAADSHGRVNYGALAFPPALVSASFRVPGRRDVIESLLSMDSFCPDCFLPRAASERAPPLI